MFDYEQAPQSYTYTHDLTLQHSNYLYCDFNANKICMCQKVERKLPRITIEKVYGYTVPG